MSLKQMRGDRREGKAGRFRKAVSSSHIQSIYCKGVHGTEKQGILQDLGWLCRIEKEKRTSWHAVEGTFECHFYPKVAST
jgi:hypothetical protein